MNLAVMKYRADIDGLRTIAVLLVLVFHFDLIAIGKAGFIGVDVFFVISGFLITAIVRNDLEARTFDIRSFLYRRVRRLYPALIATLLLTLGAGAVLLLPHKFEELATQTLWSLLYVINFYLWQNINYFGVQAGSSPLLHFWSLAVEEQFYVFFPIACWVIWKWAPKLLLPAVIIAAIISFGLGYMLGASKPQLSFYLMPTRAWELLLGAVLALAVHNRTPKGPWLAILGPFGLLTIAFSIWLYGPLTIVPGWFSLLPTLGAMAIIVGGYATTAPTTKLLASAPMVWIGKISYPLYLVHWPIKIFLQEHTLEFSYDWRLLGFVLSFIFAAAIYYLFETPVRQGRFLNSPRRFVATTVVLTVAICVGSFAIVQTKGAPGRFEPEIAQILSYRDDTPPTRRHCTSQSAIQDQACWLGDMSQTPDVLIIGDSHAFALTGALNHWLSEEQRSGVLWYNHGCMPVLNAGRARCQATAREVIAYTTNAPDVQEVFLVSIWRQAIPQGGKPFGDRWVPEENVAGVFLKELTSTVNQLTDAGVKVTIVDPLFAAAGHVPDRLAANKAFGRDWPVDRSHAEHLKTFLTVHAAFEGVTGPEVQRISLITPFCQEGLCRAVLDGRPLFTDSNHLAYSHGERIADQLRSELAQ